MSNNFTDQLQRDFDVTAVLVRGCAIHSIYQRWLETFCPHVKQTTGRWVYKGYLWHAYSFHFEKAIKQDRAFEEYQARPLSPFYLLLESTDVLFDCTAAAWPDIRKLDDDICIFPHAMDWTFHTTHEMSIGLGPYFATPPS